MYESRSLADNANPLLDQLLTVLCLDRAGLFVDVDGTISPIEARPEQAQVLPLARDALRRLRNRLALVAVVTGRTIPDAQRMLQLDGLLYVGNHGLELWDGRGVVVAPEARPWVPRIGQTLDGIRRRLSAPGILIEDKGVTGSVHYRLAPDSEAARAAILTALAATPAANGLRVEDGRMVVNLFPPLRVTKGSTVRWLCQERLLHGAVYFGDDLTDAHAFESMAAMRVEEGRQTLSVAVLGRETPAAVRRLADAAVGSVDEVASLLATVADRLEW